MSTNRQRRLGRTKVIQRERRKMKIARDAFAERFLAAVSEMVDQFSRLQLWYAKFIRQAQERR